MTEEKKPKKRGPKPGFQPKRHGFVRRCLTGMIVGQTCAFFPAEGMDRTILQAANERWPKELGWKFSTSVCVTVDALLGARRCILVTRVA